MQHRFLITALLLFQYMYVVNQSVRLYSKTMMHPPPPSPTDFKCKITVRSLALKSLTQLTEPLHCCPAMESTGDQNPHGSGLRSNSLTFPVENRKLETRGPTVHNYVSELS